MGQGLKSFPEHGKMEELIFQNVEDFEYITNMQGPSKQCGVSCALVLDVIYLYFLSF